jgi:hypothetical protein
MRALLVIAAVAALAGGVPAAEAEPDFNADFVDETLRVDYFHTGHAAEELVTLDRVYRQGIWAGSRRHLLDPFNTGNYYVKVFDAASGRLIYSKGFDSYFGEYKTTGPAGEGVRRTYHETALLPCPRQKIRFTLEVRGRDRILRPLFAAEIDPAATTVDRTPLPGDVIVVEAHAGGDPHGSVDIAVLGDGYTAAEEAKFRADLKRFVDVFFSLEPYKSRRDWFNFRGVLRPSADSGCDEPGRGVWRRTALGASFDSLGLDRYMLTEENRAIHDVAAHVPYDALLIMVNQPRYGGGGIYNFFCTFTSDNQWHAYLLLHEFGHSFAGLADEYYTSAVAYNDFYPAGVEPTEPNITALLDPARLKWADSVTPGTAVPTPWEKAEYDALDAAQQKARTGINARIAQAMRDGAPAEEIARLKDEAERQSKEHADRLDTFLAASAFAGRVGAFEGAGYTSRGLYRPMLDCLMFSKGDKPFCKVCERAVLRVMEHYRE